ncbi:MAG: hypothetical protein IIB44_04310 [Candidatus Marinimicrobia bacterium]|nr:hypothetical protein [Candidatus Neomarinimicrobiota bacterium]MCH8069597.1 hypothetical protein [Candidatus Neomarinimicrobiota bacterium]
MGKKTTTFNKTGIKKLPNNKPVLYKIKTESGNTNYVGKAKRGRVQERIREHIGKIPGTRVQIEQFSSIKDAGKKEGNVIKKSQPKYNKKGK